jgi:serine/threonine-protein kinase
MSPEQVRGDALDGRSDLFAAGALLWELCTGAPLFARPTADATLDAVLHAEVPPPSSRAPELPAELDAICARALARDPAERYASAAEFHAALGRFLYARPSPITAAQVAALVAEICPPRGPSRAARPSAPPPDDEPAAGSSTKVIPRARRAATVRTFATSTALAALDATPVRRAAPTPAEAAAAPLPAPTPTARRGARAVVALLALAMIGTLLVRRLGAPRARPAARPPAAAPIATAVPAPADAGPADAGPPPAADAAPTATRRVPDRPPPERTPRAPDPPDPVAAPAPTGRLEVGANPWADVYLDGARIGRAPGAFAVPAGRHDVELRFRDRSRRYQIAVTADQTSAIETVDFTAP